MNPLTSSNLRWLILILLTFCTSVTFGRDLKTHFDGDLEQLYNELYEQATSTTNLEELPPPDSIVKLTNNTKYAIVVWDAQTLKDKASFNALLSISIPGDAQKLLFYGEQVSFSNDVGIKGKVRLKLVQDVAVMKGDVVSLIFKANSTYAEIDCQGFDKMSLGMDLEFSKEHVLKEKPDGTIDEKERVKTSFTLTLKDFSDFLVNINIPTFQIRGIKDLSFTASQVYLDFSDYANPPNLPLDVKYDTLFKVDSTAKMWQGVYMTSVSIKLPKFLKKDKSGQRIEIGANNMIIDEHGFTGSVFAGNLVGLNNGNLGKWAFSLDQLGVVLKKSDLEQGYFKGKLRIPIGKEKDTLGYQCTIGRNGSYGFKTNSITTMSFPILKADTVKILPNSCLTIFVKGDTVKIRASLNGTMSISAPIVDAENDARFKVGNLGFEGLEVANYAPELKIKAIQFTTADKEKSPQLANFPLNISEIKLTSEGKTMQLGITLMLNLTAKFGAGGGITLHGKISEQDGKVKYEFDRTQLNSFKIDVAVTKFKMKGEITSFNKDTQFGNGFKGNIDMTLALTDANPINLKVGALFGKIRTHRYWFVDASASGLNVPVFTGVNITGFAGGAYQGMNKSFTSKNPLGKTISGQMYLPDSTAGMGFQAGVTLAIPKPQTFTGRLMLELAFNKTGGLRRIFFLGEGECMPQSGAITNLNKMVEKINKINPLPTDAQAKVATDQLANDIPIVKHFATMDQASVESTFGAEQKSKDILKMSLMVDMNFETDELVANFKPYISVGNGAIQGTKGGGLAGEGDLYFGPDKWHINMGKPSNRIEISVLGIATFSSYFMVGTDIEGSPAPPVEIAQILNLDASKLDYMRDLNAMGNGAGIAFGSAMKIETGERQFLIFYYRITAGSGFDIMLKDYGNNAFCVGRPGPLGVNGWYANGQAYAYFQGTVGIQVNLAFTKGRFEILSVGAAALLQAKLPNPTWMRGIVGGQYKILNGLVKGKCRIEVELGEQCIPSKAGALDDVQVIAQLTPENNKTDVSVFAKPQAVFNIPVGEAFSIEDPMYPGTFKKYRAVLKTFDVKQKSGGMVIGDTQWNDDLTTVVFKSSEILSPQKDFMFRVEVGFEEEINNTWQAYKDNSGKSQTENKDVTFKTGDAPDHIPTENLQFTYPALSHKNFYKDMSKTGYIQLIQGQSYLFTDAKYSPSVWMIDAKGLKTEIPVKYDVAKKNVVYTLPNLQTDKFYQLSFENMPKDRNAALDKNVTTQSKAVVTANNDTSSTATLNTKSATGVVEEVQGKVLLAYPFRTSMHNTLQDKLATNTVEASYFNSVDYQGHALGARFGQPKEPFDASELNADQNLLSFEVNFRNHAWYTNKLKGFLYQTYPVLGNLKVDRDTSDVGFVPTRDVTFTQTLPTENLTDENLETKTVTLGKSTYTLTGNFHRTMYQDFYQIRAQVANLYSKGVAVGNYANMLTEPYPGINRDRGFIYPVEVYYWFPWEPTKRKVSTLNVVLN